MMLNIATVNVQGFHYYPNVTTKKQPKKQWRLKLVTKEEGAKMTCMKCNTLLTCRTKEYKGDYASTLQWQNEDGTAHYRTNNGKDFTCVIPNEANTSDNRVETNIDPESLDEQGKEIFKNLLLLDKIDKMAINYLGKDAQVQKIGLWTKVIFQGMSKK